MRASGADIPDIFGGDAGFPRVRASDAAILRKGRRITVSGAGAVFDLMLRLAEDQPRRACMTDVACWFQHLFARDEQVRQKVRVARAGGSADALADPSTRAIRLFGAHVDDPLHFPDVAAAVDMSEPSLVRRFTPETGKARCAVTVWSGWPRRGSGCRIPATRCRRSRAHRLSPFRPDGAA